MKVNRAMRILSRIPHYLKASIFWDKNDVLLNSFPKSGNTWIRNIILNYIGLSELDKEVITFSDLDTMMPGFGKSNFFNQWDYMVPKFAASHLPYGLYFRKPKKVLIIRDPRDVMVSYYHYVNKKENSYHFESFLDLVKDKKLGLEAWFKHSLSWAGKYDFLIQYEELLENDMEIVKQLFDRLGISYESKVLEKAVINSRFVNFKKVEEKYGHSNPERNKKGFTFARKGVAGEYLNYFGDEENKVYSECLKRYKIDSYKDVFL